MLVVLLLLEFVGTRDHSNTAALLASVLLRRRWNSVQLLLEVAGGELRMYEEDAVDLKRTATVVLAHLETPSLPCDGFELACI